MPNPLMKQMLDAQDLEKELVALKQQANAIAVPLEKARARRQAFKTDMLRLSEKREQVRKQIRSAEADLQDHEKRRKTVEERIAQASNPRQVGEMEKALQSTANEISLVEESTLELLEREEQLTRQMEELQARTDRDVGKIDEEIQRLEGLLKEKQDLSADLREERVAALNRMEPEHRENYEWLVKKHGPGQAVVSCAEGACGGCGGMLLPDQLIKVRDATELHRCTHCYRFMLYDL